ncbi:MAG: MoaD/ThiS family protein [Pyrinomonadaceae bacterium]
MEIHVLFFGATADAVGSRELELSVDDGRTAGSVMDQISKDHPALANHKLLIAVNEEYADPDTILTDGDELALFTAVSGG